MDTSSFCGCVVQLSLFTKILLGHCFHFLLREIGDNGYANFFGRKTSPGERVVLRISGDGNDRRIFGFEIFYSGFFFVGKFGWLDLSRDFFGIQNNLKICARE